MDTGVLERQDLGQTRELRRRGLIVTGYRRRFRDGSLVDVCVLGEGGRVRSIGLSCCSGRDEYRPLWGKVRATGYAMRALRRKKNVHKAKMPPAPENLALFYVMSQVEHLGVYDPARMMLFEDVTDSPGEGKGCSACMAEGW